MESPAQMQFRSSQSGEILDFDSIDKNKDGVISRAEWDSAMAQQNREYFKKGTLSNYDVALLSHGPR